MGPVRTRLMPHMNNRSLLLALLFSLLLVGSSSANPMTVMESDSRHISLKLEGLLLQWQEVPLQDGAVVLFDPFVEGMPTSGTPGGVRTPASGGWLLVPPGTSPRIVSRDEKWSSAGNRALMVAGIPVGVENENSEFPTMSEILVLPGDVIPADAVISDKTKILLNDRFQGKSGSALELGEIKWWRGHRIVSWRLRPLRHEAGLASEVLTDGNWDIVFEVEKAGSAPIPAGHLAKSDNQNDERFSSFLLNGHLVKTLPTEAGYQGVSPSFENKNTLRGGKSGTLLGSVEARIGVQQTRLYRITYDRLRSLGYLPDQVIEERQMRLYQRRYLARLDDGSGKPPYVEIEIPIRMVGEDDNFDGDDFFVFYGLRLRDDVDFLSDVGQGEELIYGCGDNQEKNNSANFYWVAASEPDMGQSWARMSEATVSPATGPPLGNYRRVEHHEEQVAYRTNPNATTEDRLFLNSYMSSEASVSFNPLWSPDPAGTAANLWFEIAGFKSGTADQYLGLNIVTDNTLVTPLATCLVDTNLIEERFYTFSPDALAGESSKMVLSSAARLFSWLNWAELQYDALYQAVDNILAFHSGQDDGLRPMVVTGFSHDDIGLIEVTDPRNPVFMVLDSSNILPDGDGWKISIEPLQSGESRHFVARGDFTGTGVGEFNYYESSVADDPINPVAITGGNPDLVVIIHPEFRDAIQRWITHRQERSGGELIVHVVEVQDLFDWYSGGLKDPWALKRFSNHAITEWGTWALMLVGDANENVLELGVSSSARGWSKDWVPTHYHVQNTSLAPEVLASDKWYATFDAGMNYPTEDFPSSEPTPWQMYVGRFPCNSVAELNNMIDKVVLLDTPVEGQDWRKKMIFFADDHWSNGYGDDPGDLSYDSYEKVFAGVERDNMSPLWRGGSPVTLEADTLFLDNYLKPIWLSENSVEPRSLSRYQRAITESNALTDLLALLSSGGLMAHYQGHASSALLCSEYWFQDLNRPLSRQDSESINNTNRPWVFFGMGCHIGDWAQDTVAGYYSTEPSLCEKFLNLPGRGASAVYGSSGYEYIASNAVFGRYIMERWIDLPPNSASTPDGAPVGEGRSRWMLGELLLCCEADVVVTNTSFYYDEMVAQFTLLGDPLMMLDAGPPVVSAILSGDPDEEISGEVDLVSSNADNLRIIDIDARDEAGISRLLVVDSIGNDLTAATVTESLPAGENDHQQVLYHLEIPVRPFAHQVNVEVFDTAADLVNDRHYTLVLNVVQDAVYMVAGEEIDLSSFQFVVDDPVDFQCEMTSGAWLDDSMVFDLQGENLVVENFVIGTGKSNAMSFTFTATATAAIESDEERSVVLSINGYETTYVLEANDAAAGDASISRVLNYPNPMRNETRFIYETSATSGQGTVRVFAVSGREVANIPFSFNGGDDRVIEWNGQDDDGDNLANGTYLYRLEMNTQSGLLVSPMQRLVVMN